MFVKVYWLIHWNYINLTSPCFTMSYLDCAFLQQTSLYLWYNTKIPLNFWECGQVQVGEKFWKQISLHFTHIFNILKKVWKIDPFKPPLPHPRNFPQFFFIIDDFPNQQAFLFNTILFINYFLFIYLNTVRPMSKIC